MQYFFSVLFHLDYSMFGAASPDVCVCVCVCLVDTTLQIKSVITSERRPFWVLSFQCDTVATMTIQLFSLGQAKICYTAKQ